MIETENTKKLFQEWPRGKEFVKMAEASGLEVEETDRDILTLRESSHLATVGLKFRDFSNDLTLFACSFDGRKTEYPLAADAVTILAYIRSRVNS